MYAKIRQNIETMLRARARWTSNVERDGDKPGHRRTLPRRSLNLAARVPKRKVMNFRIRPSSLVTSSVSSQTGHAHALVAVGPGGRRKLVIVS